MTRQQLADALVSHTGILALRELIVSSGWGSPLKPSAFRGDLCFGPSQGQNVHIRQSQGMDWCLAVA